MEPSVTSGYTAISMKDAAIAWRPRRPESAMMRPLQGAGAPLPDAQHQTLSGQVQLLPEPYRQVMQQHLDKVAPPRSR